MRKEYQTGRTERSGHAAAAGPQSEQRKASPSSTRRTWGTITLAFLALAACGPANPVLGDWEVDAQETSSSALVAVEATQLGHLSFTGAAVVAGETEIPGSWVVEEGGVRFVREDGRGEHLVELLPEDRIRIELPIGSAPCIGGRARSAGVQPPLETNAAA